MVARVVIVPVSIMVPMGPVVVMAPPPMVTVIVVESQTVGTDRETPAIIVCRGRTREHKGRGKDETG
jgi:hypothetical protein